MILKEQFFLIYLYQSVLTLNENLYNGILVLPLVFPELEAVQESSLVICL